MEEICPDGAIIVEGGREVTLVGQGNSVAVQVQVLLCCWQEMICIVFYYNKGNILGNCIFAIFGLAIFLQKK